MADPTQFRNYQVVERAGPWKAGTIYLAKDPATGDLVAVKTLDLAAGADPQLLPRFLREGQVCRKLRHPNIQRLITSGVQDGKHFLVLEHVGGTSLRNHLRELTAPAAIPWCVRVLRQLLEALECAHAAGVLHRQITPDTVRMAAADRAVLTGFGVAANQDQLLESVIGQQLGDAHYSSPEQNLGQVTTEASDLYALGLVFWEMLTGLQALPGARAKVCDVQRRDRIPAPSARRRSVPADIDSLVARMLLFDRDVRYQTARQVLEAIRGVEAFMAR